MQDSYSFISNKRDASRSGLYLLDFVLLPVVRLARRVLQARSELLHHRVVVTCIIASNMADL